MSADPIRLKMKNKAELFRNRRKFWHIRLSKTFDLLEEVFKTGWSDKNPYSTRVFTRIAKGMNRATCREQSLAARKWAPFAVTQNFEITIKGEKGLVLSCMQMRRRATAGRHNLDDQAGGAVCHLTVCENIDLLTKNG